MHKWQVILISALLVITVLIFPVSATDSELVGLKASFFGNGIGEGYTFGSSYGVYGGLDVMYIDSNYTFGNGYEINFDYDDVNGYHIDVSDDIGFASDFRIRIYVQGYGDFVNYDYARNIDIHKNGISIDITPQEISSISNRTFWYRDSNGSPVSYICTSKKCIQFFVDINSDNTATSFIIPIKLIPLGTVNDNFTSYGTSFLGQVNSFFSTFNALSTNPIIMGYLTVFVGGTIVAILVKMGENL